MVDLQDHFRWATGPWADIRQPGESSAPVARRRIPPLKEVHDLSLPFAMKNIHLLVCIHGLWGTPDHLAELARIIKEKYPTGTSGDVNSGVEMDVLVATSNKENWTYDGIDWGAERVANEVQAHIVNLQADSVCKVTRFSVIGYSLGGLLARYLVCIFHSRQFFQEVTPYNFITIATPHVGLPRYPGFRSACFNALSPRVLSRTGKQLSLADEWLSSKRPLLEVMADPDQMFYESLSIFPRIEVYANAVKDATVPYLTGAIELEDPFLACETNGLDIEIDASYDPMIKSFTQPTLPPPPFPGPPLFSMAFLRSLKPTPLLIRVPVPMQLIIWISVPLLLPLFMAFTVVRLYLHSRASEARIKVLENSGTTLINSLRALEMRTEDAIADIVDEPSVAPPTSAKQPRGRPTLTPLQQSMVASLNSLPQMRKHFAFVNGVFNSHSVIVCRNVQTIALHKRGEGVLRHLADNLVV